LNRRPTDYELSAIPLESTRYAVSVTIFRIFPPFSTWIGKQTGKQSASKTGSNSRLDLVVSRFMRDCGEIHYVVLLETAAVILQQVYAKNLGNLHTPIFQLPWRESQRRMKPIEWGIAPVPQATTVQCFCIWNLCWLRHERAVAFPRRAYTADHPPGQAAGHTEKPSGNGVGAGIIQAGPEGHKKKIQWIREEISRESQVRRIIMVVKVRSFSALDKFKFERKPVGAPTIHK
jgi:hypothetical protein